MKATQLLHNLGQSLWLDNITRAGVKIDALAAQLQEDGAKSFVKSWNELMMVITSKSGSLKQAV